LFTTYLPAILALALTLFAPPSGAAAQTSAPPPVHPPLGPFRIAGTVVNALNGSPLARARVTIQEVHNRDNLQWTITSEDGHFEFKQLPAGKYGLRGAKRGFIFADYEQHEQFSTAIVTGAGVDTEHLMLRLSR
jgi:Carboxypeptidase regulatory-like domain